MADRTELINPEHRLPDLRLRPFPGGEPRPVRPGGRSSAVLLLAHGGGCAACAAYLRELRDASAALEEWDARLVLVSSDPVDTAADQLLDADGRLAALLGLPVPAVLVADQWGQIHHAMSSPDHGLSNPGELVAWARFLAIQCPECQGEAY